MIKYTLQQQDICIETNLDIITCYKTLNEISVMSVPIFVMSVPPHVGDLQKGPQKIKPHMKLNEVFLNDQQLLKHQNNVIYCIKMYILKKYTNFHDFYKKKYK